VKFNEIYRGEDPNLSLGRFYNTDIRKLVAFRQREPRLFPDEMEDPMSFLTDRVQSEDTLYFTMRYRKKVLGYGSLDPIGKRVAQINSWANKWTRMRRHWVVGLVRLLVEFGFKELGLERMGTWSADFAKANQNVLRDVGFTQEGILRKATCYDSSPTDIILFGLLKEEF